MATLTRDEIVSEAREALSRWKFDDMRRGDRIRANLEHILSGADAIGTEERPALHWCSSVTDFLHGHCFTQCPNCLATDTHPQWCVRCHDARR